MAARVALTQGLRQLAISPIAFTVSSKYTTNLPVLLKAGGGSLSFARSFSKPSDEVSSEPNTESEPTLVVDQKDASKMRNRVIPVETSMKYLKSKGKYHVYCLSYMKSIIKICFLRLFNNLWFRTCMGKIPQKFQGPVCSRDKKNLHSKFTVLRKTEKFNTSKLSFSLETRKIKYWESLPNMQRWVLDTWLQKCWVIKAVHFAIQWSYSANTVRWKSTFLYFFTFQFTKYSVFPGKLAYVKQNKGNYLWQLQKLKITV